MHHSFPSATAVAETLRPSEPVYCLRSQVLSDTARDMVAAFPGDILYAVKCNATPAVLRALRGGGVYHFDTASIDEVRLVRSHVPDAVCHFMHPVKSPEAIAEAYHRHGVRAFVLDHIDELRKIEAATGHAADLTLVVRLATPANQSLLCLSGKFGCTLGEAATLLRQAQAPGRKLGLTFHVGSQCVSPDAYARAIELCGRVLSLAQVPLDVLDIGGGFPGAYQGDEPAFTDFVAAVRAACAEIGLPDTVRLQCEPGRALVAEGMSVLTRVELRRGNALYLNDGTYGALPELKFLGPHFPMRVVRPGGRATGRLVGFDLYGPTCDSVDTMPGPHWLPDDIATGDWIEIGAMGAYSTALRTGFNGFDRHRFVEVRDVFPRALAEDPARAEAA